MRMVPQDPVMLLSFVNTNLRDHFASLEELCAALDLSREELCEKLAKIDYEYDPAQNRFV